MLKCILLSKEASLKRLYTLYPPNCTFWKRGNYKNSLKKKKRWLPEVQRERRGMNRGNAGHFKVGEATLCDSVTMDACLYGLVKTHKTV